MFITSHMPSVRHHKDALRLAALAAATLVCLAACSSGRMTRARASELILSGEAFQKPASISLLPEYRQSLTLIGAGSQTSPKEEFALKRFLESHADLAALNHLGLVDFKVVRIEYPDSASSPVVVAATITDKGRSASDEWQRAGNGWSIPIARRELVEVTGLTGGEGGDKTARAEYTWRWQPTEIGKYFDTSRQEHQSLPEDIRRNLGGVSMADVLRQLGGVISFDSGKMQTASASFRLYDNGWRLEK
ncbi:MAG: hypothetical protein JOZ96_11545 [Acidobacteria bacterium]|nr:hypothetical protein [Acidobacteriota bacterium]